MHNKRRTRRALAAAVAATIAGALLVVVPEASAATTFERAVAACKRWAGKLFPHRKDHPIVIEPSGPGEHDALAGGHDGGNPVWYGFEPVAGDVNDNVFRNHFVITYRQLDEVELRHETQHIVQQDINNLGGIVVYQGDRMIGRTNCGA